MKFYWFDSNANPASRFSCAILRISPVGKASVLGTGNQRFESVILNQSKKIRKAHTAKVIRLVSERSSVRIRLSPVGLIAQRESAKTCLDFTESPRAVPRSINSMVRVNAL